MKVSLVIWLKNMLSSNIMTLPMTPMLTYLEPKDMPLQRKRSRLPSDTPWNCMELLWVKRSNIIDIAFILLIDLISNGTYHFIGTSNACFICFLVLPNGCSMLPTTFAHAIPLSKWIFSYLQELNDAIQKLIWHNPECRNVWKSQQIFFLNEGFSYLEHKVLQLDETDGVIHDTFNISTMK